MTTQKTTTHKTTLRSRMTVVDQRFVMIAMTYELTYAFEVREVYAVDLITEGQCVRLCSNTDPEVVSSVFEELKFQIDALGLRNE